MNTIKQWLAKQGGVSHVLAVSWLFLTGAFTAVPQFHHFVLAAIGATPHGLRSFILCIGPLIAFYHSTHKEN